MPNSQHQQVAVKSSKISIGLIEDSAQDAFFLERAIKKQLGRADALHWIGDAEQGLSWLFSQEAQAYSLILIDLKMPKLSGLDILEQLMQKNAFDLLPPIVMLTSSDAPSDRQCALSYPISEFKTKPEGYRAYKELVQELIDKWVADVNNHTIKSDET